MKNIKELFKNAKIKVVESKVGGGVKNLFTKISNSKIITSMKTKFSSLKSSLKNFMSTQTNVVNSMAPNVNSRFSEKFKKFFKKSTKKIQNKATNGNKFAKFATVVIKILAILATIAFAALVIYCIKDVFMYCLMFVATCAAVVICIEFILSVLSIATGATI